ncbi:TetR/AcrR family transcriptional regulator [Nocardia sp. NPDC058176]|uniref:TetR/AcrR family transcriptional regulator n=1 Tax=Nocardia sp. NPDC058176 TaxID=3346368 RepID=UPI0036DAB397
MAAGSTTRSPHERGDQSPLSRDQIVAEAIRLLDEEGFDALSMRKLGARLDAGATSLYTHVANKDELLELVVDRVIGEIPVPAPDALRWRAVMHEQAAGVRATMLAHPWITVVLSSAALSYLGPNMMRLTDSLIAILEVADITDEVVDLAADAIFRFIVGSCSSEAAVLMTIARGGLPAEQWVSRQHRRYAGQLARSAAATSARVPEKFTLELDLILDGVDARRG